MTQAALQTESSISPSQVEIVRIHHAMRNGRVDEQMIKHLEPAIAMANGRIGMEQIFMLLATDQAQVWFSMDGDECITVLVTEVCEWVSGRRSLKVILAGGYGSLTRTMEPFFEKMEEFALLEICSSIMVEGRKGWEKTLPDGYEFSHCTFEKEIL